MDRTPTPRGLLRLFLRFPILLYRLGLGWLLGDRFLMMTHIGRQSGLSRRVVLEVVRHDRQNHTYVIASGWGEQSQWVLNIQKNPDVLLQAGIRKWKAVASRLNPEQGERELTDYARRHPTAFRGLAKWYHLTIPPEVTTEPICRQLAGRIPLFALRPQSG